MYIPGAHALKPGDFLRLLFIRWPDQMSTVGTGCRKHSFKFQTGYHIGGSIVAIYITNGRIEDLTAGRYHYCPYTNLDLFFYIGKIDGFSRTKLLTGLAFAFLDKINAGLSINGVFERNRLGVFHIDGLAFGQPGVVFVNYLLGTLLGAKTTGNAFVHINVAGMLPDLDCKISRLPREALHLSEGQKLDVEMPADLDQFGRDNSHGTVIGGKGLVQLRHQPTYGGRPLHQIDIIAGVGQIQSRLHPGNTPTHHHH
jgi:hypothetical protein